MRAKPRRSRKVANVVGHNCLTSRGYGQLQDEFVARIGQGWPPQKVNLLSMADLTEVVDETLSLGPSQAQRPGVTNEDGLILQRQWHRHRDFESPRA